MSRYQEIKDKLLFTPSYNKKGAAFLADLWNCSVADILKARQEIKEQTNIQTELTDKRVKQIETDLEAEDREGDSLTGIVNKAIAADGGEVITLVSNKPLSPQEIDEYAQVDNITSRVASYWLKSSTKNTFTYAVQVKRSITNFYSMEELSEKLKALVPDIKPSKLPNVEISGTNVGLLCISDMHAGAQNSTLNIHGISYSEEDLNDRLQVVAENIIKAGKVYETLIIANLGDSLDGWDGFTTRKGHSLGSVSSREQFDIYFRCMTNFYATLFESKIAESYVVYNCLDSNHEGIDFAYICNTSVQNVLSLKYPEVQFIQQEEFINTMEIGNHVIAFAHGKDAKIMKYPMKKVLDERLDLWATQYFHHKGYENFYKTLIKGDLHVFGVEQGKFGNYINVPSVYGTSDYISLNYGVTRPGALMLDINPEEDDITIKPIWL